jgi:SAM-dependent methyltransferase
MPHNQHVPPQDDPSHARETPSSPEFNRADRERLRGTFDDDADAYDRTRPVAPAIVFDDAVALAGLERGASVLEIGPGTGQATRPLAERGLRVRAVELGPALAERARTNLTTFPDVVVVTASFEDWDPRGEQFDAVFSCNAFHWIDPDVRFAKPAALLPARGHLILLATPWVIPDHADRFWWDVQDDFVAVGGERVDPATSHPDRVQDGFARDIEAWGLFGPPIVRRYLFDVEFTTDDYLANLSTQSGVKQFSEPARSELYARIRDRLDRSGGRVRAHLLAILNIASRL